MLTLGGRSVVVTNAATDLARAICAELRRAGARVTAQRDGRISAQQVVANAVEAFGCLDGFVNCHTLQPEACGPAESLSMDVFRAAIQANLDEPFFGCQAAAAQMLDQVCGHAGPNPEYRGCIVNVTSVAAVLALPGHAAFLSAMAGLTAVTRVLAAEWGPAGIRVAAIGAGLSDGVLSGVLPAGPVARRVPRRSVVSPERVAQAVCFVLGDGGDGIAGATVYVDGGWLADGYWE